MRGPDIQQDSLFSAVSPETRVPKDHPLRPIRAMVDTALKAMDADFAALYAHSGRESIPPEKLLRAQLLMALYTIRSERQLMEQINYNLLFRWFAGLLGFRWTIRSGITRPLPRIVTVCWVARSPMVSLPRCLARQNMPDGYRRNTSAWMEP